MGPFAGALGFFEGEICSVLLEVDLDDESDAVGIVSHILLDAHSLLLEMFDVRIQASLVLAEQGQCLLRLPRLLQHNANQ